MSRKVPKPKRIPNRDAHQYTSQLLPFEGSNLSGRRWMTNPSNMRDGDHGYVVMSYDRWPLFAHTVVNGQSLWFENGEKITVTTSKHRTQAHPRCATTVLDSIQINLLCTYGYRRGLMLYRMGHTEEEVHGVWVRNTYGYKRVEA